MNEIDVVIKKENGTLVVSSRDIARGLDKEHKHVLNKIKEVLGESEFWPTSYIDSWNREQVEYLLPKNSFILLVMNYQGYNDFKRAYIKRFDEMENKLKCMPEDYVSALRALADKEEERLLIEKQRDEAIRTKAWISDKKTATAMNTASQYSKENQRLKIELDKSKEYASIRAVEKMAKIKFDWRKLRNYCTAKELEMKKVSDPLYGKINTYPKEAWQKVYGINLEYLF